MVWTPLLAYVTGAINQGLLLRNEYLVAENRILKAKVKWRLVLSEGEKATLAEIAHRLGRKVLEEVTSTAQPDTILGWYRKLIARRAFSRCPPQGMGRGHQIGNLAPADYRRRGSRDRTPKKEKEPPAFHYGQDEFGNTKCSCPRVLHRACLMQEVADSHLVR